MNEDIMDYRFDEKISYLFPENYTCRYCTKIKSNPKNYNVILPITKVAQSLDLIILKSIKYKEVKMLIPRCRSCQTVHEKTRTKTWTIVILTYLVISALSIWLLGLNGIFVAVLLPVLMVFVFDPISNFLLKNHGILDKYTGFQSEPMYQKLKKAGWQMGKPM